VCDFEVTNRTARPSFVTPVSRTLLMSTPARFSSVLNPVSLSAPSTMSRLMAGFLPQPDEICPLMAMIRHRVARGSGVPTHLLYSSRLLEDVIYKDEIDRLAAFGDGLEVFTRLRGAGRMTGTVTPSVSTATCLPRSHFLRSSIP
jgi:hypothetical protein